MIQAILLMLVLGALLGAGLGIAAKYLHVAPDERVEFVYGKLPGYNCGGCGYPGCEGFANALVSGESAQFKCRPCKQEEKQAIIDYLASTPGPDGNTIKVKA